MNDPAANHPVTSAASPDGVVRIDVAQLDDIDHRQDEIIRALDGLNDQILAVLRENGIAVPKPPANLRINKAA